MIKKISLLFFTLFIPLIFSPCAFGIEEDIIKENTVQTRIDDVGTKILNSNKIDERIVFVYDKTEQKEKLNIDKTLVTRQVVLYGYDYKFIEDDNELAAFLSRRIAEAHRSYAGVFNGRLSSLKMKAAPKKFQIVFDKVAVDYMVHAGYNPVALITLINKTYPQKRSDALSTSNLASKRLAVIYEYIYTKYPYFLLHNEYFENIHYQNFLLTSQDNRKKLEEKVKSRSRGEINYE